MQGQVWGAGRSFLGGGVCIHFMGGGGSGVPGTEQEPGLEARPATWCWRPRHCSGRRQDGEERPKGPESQVNTRMGSHRQQGIAASVGKEHVSDVGAPEGPALPGPDPKARPFPPCVPAAQLRVGGRSRVRGSAESTGSTPLWEPRPLAPLQRAGKAGHIPAGGHEALQSRVASKLLVDGPMQEGGARDPGLECSWEKPLACGWGE